MDWQNEIGRVAQDLAFNNAGLAPISRAARDTLILWAQRFWEQGFATDESYKEQVWQTREEVARWFRAQSLEVAFFTNVASAVSQIASNLNLQPGDEVLMLEQDYPSLLYPWQRRCEKTGAHLRLVSSNENLSIDLEAIKNLVNSNTKVFAMSWVQYQTGATADLSELIKWLKEKQIFVLIDVMQGAGFFACDLWDYGVDAIVGGSHKWLLSPVGVGYLILREVWINQFQPLLIGSQTYGSCDDPSNFACTPKRDASKFEPGSKQSIEIMALGASMKWLGQTDLVSLRQQAIEFTNLIEDTCYKKGWEILSSNPVRVNSFLNIKLSPSLESLVLYLKQNQVQFAIRADSIRLSFHAFHHPKAIERLVLLINNYKP